MSQHTDIPRVAMQVSRGVVVASIQVDLEEDVLELLREDLLRRIQESSSRAVILDVSGLETLDSEELAALRRIITMADLMGARAVLAGLRPGVVSSLIETDADIEGLQAAINLDAAFELLQPELAPESDAAVSENAEPEEAPEGANAEENPPENAW